jgi:hypothetical protein
MLPLLYCDALGKKKICGISYYIVINSCKEVCGKKIIGIAGN